MPSRKTIPQWFSFERIKPALIMGLVLFAASFVADITFIWLGASSKARIFNNLAIGIVGALLLAFYLTASYQHQAYLRARERMILIAELNHHVRGALSLIEESSMIDNREERIRRVDEAVNKIDVVLTELVPTIGSASGPRFELPRYN
jgi:hypothetical protein